LDLVPSENMIFLRYTDIHGVVGIVGNTLSKSSINIAGMQVARNHLGGEALMALTVDSAVESDVVESLTRETGAKVVRSVTLGG